MPIARDKGGDKQPTARVLNALATALQAQLPEIEIDPRGYVSRYQDNLLPSVSPGQFRDELLAGDGNELAGKFRAAHSSSALAVNTFAPFKDHLCDLILDEDGPYTELHFERKCPTGLRSRRAPNLDVLLSDERKTLGIESKLSEHLRPKAPKFSTAYFEEISDDRRQSAWFREMEAIAAGDVAYAHLDAAQLIKHAFGLAHSFPETPVTLLYLYWEPQNATGFQVFKQHREEISRLHGRLGAQPRPGFRVLSYDQLISRWAERSPPAWLRSHLQFWRARYELEI